MRNFVSYGEIPPPAKTGQIIQPLFDQDSLAIQMIQEGVAVHVQNGNQGFLRGCQSQYAAILGKILKIYLKSQYIRKFYRVNHIAQVLLRHCHGFVLFTDTLCDLLNVVSG